MFVKKRTYTAYVLYYILRYVISYISYLYLILFELDGEKRSYCTFNAHFFFDILSFFIVITDHSQTKKLVCEFFFNKIIVLHYYCSVLLINNKFCSFEGYRNE